MDEFTNEITGIGIRGVAIMDGVPTDKQRQNKYWKDQARSEYTKLEANPNTRVSIIEVYLGENEDAQKSGDTKKFFYYKLERLYLERRITFRRASNNQPIQFQILDHEACAHEFDGLFLPFNEVINFEAKEPFRAVKDATSRRWREAFKWFIVKERDLPDIDAIIGTDLCRSIEDEKEKAQLIPFLSYPYPQCFTKKDTHIFKYVNGKFNTRDEIPTRVYREQLYDIWKFRNHDVEISEMPPTRKRRSDEANYWENKVAHYTSLLEGVDPKKIVYTSSRQFQVINKFFYLVLEFLDKEGHITIYKRAQDDQQPIEFRIVSPSQCQPHFNCLFLTEHESVTPKSLIALKKTLDERWKITLKWFTTSEDLVRMIDDVVGDDPHRKLPSEMNEYLTRVIAIPFPLSFSTPSQIFRFVNVTPKNLRFGLNKASAQKYHANLRSIHHGYAGNLPFYGHAFDFDELFEEPEIHAHSATSPPSFLGPPTYAERSRFCSSPQPSSHAEALQATAEEDSEKVGAYLFT